MKLTFEELIAQAGQGKDTRSLSDEQKKMDMLAALGIEHKADEVLSTINNTNWYDAYGMVNDIKDLTPKYGKVLQSLAGGYEGNNLPVSYPIPFDITDYYMQGKSEWEDEARPSINARTQTDSKGTLSQTKLILEFGVSDAYIKHATDKQLYEKLLQKLTKTFTRTVESMIINGDTESGGTGNVNSDDQAPATTFSADGGSLYHATLLDHGIRENAVTNSNTVDIGGFDSDDMLSVLRQLGEMYQEEFADLLFLSNSSTYSAMAADDGFKLASSRNGATAIDTGVISKPWGIDLISTSLVPKTEADGKMSATGSNNTLGQFLLVFKPAVRWGYGQDFQIEVERIPGYGYHMVATVELGFVILDVANTCAMGRNVTIT
ncbi:hypothetical protein A2125_00910 [Candidatus Woesebacteria bacterium GWB1_43_5]|uniref:Major capsid protein n=1 Tax=Candidatus Woesebacteria bacterium GWB1_43_5 TaxID=1802474 RepID=A0A1F7WTR7_9BACT|nr:MAG: hypothetical protein A2125_00910 [Candidatus Woesebacteria bacterium GWB1_43_5]